MKALTKQPRLIFIDHLRAFIFTLLVFDHTIHAYAYHWGKFHFFQDFDRSIVCDVIFMNNNSIIMPMLFFIFGLFVLPSLQRRGLRDYTQQRLIKLGIPYVLGILLIVPLLVFPRYQFTENPVMGYVEFWKEVYFVEKLQGGGPFWVLFCLLLFSTILIFIYYLIPVVIKGISQAFSWMIRNPILGFCLFALISMIILGASDLRWGAPWWIGLDPIDSEGDTALEILNKIIGLFHLQGSRFLLHALYFIAGVGLSYAGLLNDKDFWQKLSEKWKFLLGLTIISGIFYIGYSLVYFDEGAYSNALRYHFKYQGGTWTNAWPYLTSEVPFVLMRTSLHGFFCLAQALTLLAIFYRFLNKPHPLWRSLGENSYGIFLLHEVPVIWMQYGLVTSDLPILFKVILVFTVGLSGTWVLVNALRKIPFVQRVL